MEVHSPDSSLTDSSLTVKKLWNILRVAFYMMRKGISTKRKLLMDMNLMMKRGKIIRKSLGNLMFHHNHHSKDMYGGVHLHHYEFSCSNTPNLVSFHVAKRKHHRFLSVPHFPCISPPEEPEEPRMVVSLPKLEYSPKIENSPEYACSFRFDTPDLAPGEMLSPLKSPFAIRVSNFSAVEEENDGSNRQVDTDAEEFIRLFYEQLRIQSRTQLLQYQEMQYQEMLARGT